MAVKRESAQRSLAAVGCAACCGIPMLVVLGSISFATALVGGVTVMAVAAVVWATLLAAARRLPQLPLRFRQGVTATGFIVAAGGLWALRTGAPTAGSALVAIAVAVLACAALASLDRGTPVQP